ncbi:MAG: thermonuclease family protein [Pseudomonadales bacterium]
MLVLVVVLGSDGAAASASDILLGRVEHVADGDSLTLLADGSRHRIRLHQIDAPEQDQPGSRESRRALAGKVDGKYVRVTVVTTDDYGRLVGQVWLGDRDINRELIGEGHAWVYRRYLEDRSLLADEATARDAGRGLWAAIDPQPPWEWRQRARAAASAQGAAEGCLIKGNINRRGERIYHQPGDRYYAETRINTSRGERWFCSEAEAKRAGWRGARSR